MQISKRFFQRYLGWFILLSFLALGSYGLIRLYYHVTGGFTIGNISSDLPYNEKWQTHQITSSEKETLHSILSRSFTYYGKGCQSYVFLSEDGKYVLKFVKFQRFRPQPWTHLLAILPGLDKYRLKKIEKKQKKLDMFLTSWRIAFDELQKESGLIYVHLNKSPLLNQSVLIYDKMGFPHYLDMNQMEFLIQKKAEMLCPTLDNLIAQNQIEGAKDLIFKLLNLITSEYARSLADNDHALMQNTGVMEGNPIHIDVGQFVFNAEIQKPEIYRQELFNKTYEFRKWLKANHPELAIFLDEHLRSLIGEQFYSMQMDFTNHHLWSK